MKPVIYTTYVITDQEFDQVIGGMQELGFVPDSQTPALSISYLEHLCSESYSMFYSKQFKCFHIMKNAKTESPGVYIHIFGD